MSITDRDRRLVSGNAVATAAICRRQRLTNARIQPLHPFEDYPGTEDNDSATYRIRSMRSWLLAYFFMTRSSSFISARHRRRESLNPTPVPLRCPALHGRTALESAGTATRPPMGSDSPGRVVQATEPQQSRDRPGQRLDRPGYDEGRAPNRTPSTIPRQQPLRHRAFRDTCSRRRRHGRETRSSGARRSPHRRPRGSHMSAVSRRARS